MPEANSHTAILTTNLIINLDSLLEPTTVTADTFVVHRGWRCSEGGDFTIGTTSFAFDPSLGFLPGELLSATVTSGIEAGGIPVTPFVWQFRAQVIEGTGEFYDSGQEIGNLDSADVALGDVDGDGDLDDDSPDGVGHGK